MLPTNSKPSVLIALALPVAAVFACSDSATQLERNATHPSVGASVAGYGAGDLVAQPTLRSGEVGGPRAEALALFRVSALGEANRAMHEKVRGAPISWSALQPCGTQFVKSPFAPLPETLALAVRRAASNWWLVTLCAGSPQITVAVNTLSEDITDGPAGFTMPQRSGNHFLPRAVRVTPHPGFMIAAEEAVDAVESITGVTVVPPVSLVKAARAIPQFARWRVQLAHDVSFRLAATGDVTEANVIYYGYHANVDHATLLVPQEAQAGRVINVRNPDRSTSALTLAVVEGAAADFVVVEPISDAHSNR